MLVFLRTKHWCCVCACARAVVIYPGMGCFWGAEKLFWRLPGIFSTQVGYTGGFTPNPTYEEVCSGTMHHLLCLHFDFHWLLTPPACEESKVDSSVRSVKVQETKQSAKEKKKQGLKDCFKDDALLLSPPSLHLQSTSQTILLQMGYTPPWPTCKDWALYCAVLRRFLPTEVLCVTRHKLASFPETMIWWTICWRLKLV